MDLSKELKKDTLKRMSKLKHTISIYGILFNLGSILRILLFLVNRDANDPHVTVMQRLFTGQTTGKNDCWECFQPKLYHGSVAFLENFLTNHSQLSFILIGQALSVLAGIGTLLIIWRFLREYDHSPFASQIAFAFIALNPSLIGINAQATNDSFIIFFSTLTFYAVWKYSVNNKLSHAFLFIFSTSLALLSKGSGLVDYLTVYIILILQIIRKATAKNITLFILFNIISLFSIVQFSPYFQYYWQYGSPFAVSINKPTQKEIQNHSYKFRPGIRSISDGYLTFHLDDLLAHPYDTNGVNNYNIHRTSFWSQLYAQFNSIHFTNNIPTWLNSSPKILNLTRLLFITALPLFAIMIIGYLSQIHILAQKIIQNKISTTYFSHNFLFVFYFTIFLLMDLYYSYTYRDFSFIKIIFIFPAIICMTQFILIGIDIILQQKTTRKYLLYILPIYCIILCTLYSYDTLLLIIQLSPNLNQLLF